MSVAAQILMLIMLHCNTKSKASGNLENFQTYEQCYAELTTCYEKVGGEGFKTCLDKNLGLLKESK